MTDPLSGTASVFTVLSFGLQVCKSILDYYQSARQSRSDVAALCVSIENLRRILEDVEKILQRSHKLGTATTVSESVQACKAGLDLLARKVDKIHRKMSNPGTQKLRAVLQYPLKESTIAKLKEIVAYDVTVHLNVAVSVLHTHHESIQSGVSTTNSSIQALRTETTSGIKNVRQDMSDLAGDIAKLHTGHTREEILKWISPQECLTDYHAMACEQREMDTGNWFIKGGQFIRWRDDPGSIYWLHSIPGCGKTVLWFNDPATQKTENMLRSLLLQLLRQHPSVPQVVSDLHQQHRYGNLPRKGLLNVLKILIEYTNQTYLIVDALDECSGSQQERESLIAILGSFKDFGLANFHILATSRKEHYLSKWGGMVSSPPINIQNVHVDSDISLHVQRQLLNDPKLSRWSGSIQEEIQNTLTEGAHGMFRWVSCQLESLRACLRPSAVRQTLRDLPKTLDETYSRILADIQEDYQKEAVSALAWLAASEQPLTLKELAEAMTINTCSIPAFDPEDRFCNPWDALTILSSLVSVTTHKFSGREILNVSLAHYSVKEYLTSTRILEGPASKFAIHKPDAQQRVLEDCLHYIACVHGKDWEEKPPLHYPLLSHAHSRWPQYALNCSSDLPLNIKRMIANLLEHPRVWNIHLYPESWDMSEMMWSHVTRYPLRFPYRNRWEDSSVPREELCKYDRKSCFNEECCRNGPYPLYYAACLGLIAIVQYLLHHKLTTHLSGLLFHNALQAASLKNYGSIVELLILNGAEVNLQGGLFGNALNAACFGGSLRSVELLLDAGFDCGLQTGWENPLSALQRSPQPNEAIAIKLLQKGYLASTEKFTACWNMQWAVIAGYEELARLLLIEMKDSAGRGENPLVSASVGKNCMKDEPHLPYNPLPAATDGAVFHQQEAVMRFLVPIRSHVNEVDAEGRTALYWACFFQWHEIAQTLLAEKADIHIRGPHGWGARYWAKLWNDQVILDMLSSACDPRSCHDCSSADAKAEVENQALNLLSRKNGRSSSQYQAIFDA